MYTIPKNKMNLSYSHSAKKTMYEQYLVNKQSFTNVNEEIAFATRQMMYVGLEDVVTIDAKWNQFTSMNNEVNYLEFIIMLLFTYHNNNDAFETECDIETV